MEREILFRGKRVDNGEWVYGIPLCDWADCSLKCKNQHKGELLTFYGWEDPFHEYNEFEVDPSTVGQYTGKELDGEKLFVGDIVESSEDYDDMWGDSKTGYARSVVVWDKDNFCYTFDTDGYIQPFNDWDWENSAKIGNIHDNPELLGGKEND